VRLAFLGSPAAAVPTLRALVDAGHDVALVISGADRRRGRGGASSPTPVKAAALELGLVVSERLDDVLDADVELGIVVAYGRIVPVRILEQVPMLNVHFSLLPRWRGAAPVERAILAGDDLTGVCVMEVAEGLDTGAVHAIAEVPIGDETTASELTDRLAVVGAELMVGVLSGGLGVGTRQPASGVTYARKLSSDDRRLDWSLPASELHRVVRIGGAWTTFRGARLKVLEAHPVDASAAASDVGTVRGTRVGCAGGTALELIRVQPEGRSGMDASDWVNGAHPEGELLGEGVDGA